MNWELREKETQGRVITAHNQEIMTLKEKLAYLTDGREEIKGEVKDKIVKEFCKSSNGEGGFLGLAIAMIMDALTKLVKASSGSKSKCYFS